MTLKYDIIHMRHVVRGLSSALAAMNGPTVASKGCKCCKMDYSCGSLGGNDGAQTDHAIVLFLWTANVTVSISCVNCCIVSTSVFHLLFNCFCFALSMSSAG